MSNYFQPEIETMPREQIEADQSAKLVKQVKHVYENVAFYRKKMDEAGIKPEDIILGVISNNSATSGT